MGSFELVKRSGISRETDEQSQQASIGPLLPVFNQWFHPGTAAHIVLTPSVNKNEAFKASLQMCASLILIFCKHPISCRSFPRVVSRNYMIQFHSWTGNTPQDQVIIIHKDEFCLVFKTRPFIRLNFLRGLCIIKLTIWPPYLGLRNTVYIEYLVSTKEMVAYLPRDPIS